MSAGRALLVGWRRHSSQSAASRPAHRCWCSQSTASSWFPVVASTARRWRSTSASQRHRPARMTRGADGTRSGTVGVRAGLSDEPEPLTEELASVLAQISQAFYADEVEAVLGSAPARDPKECQLSSLVGDHQLAHHQSPLLTHSSTSHEKKGDANSNAAAPTADSGSPSLSDPTTQDDWTSLMFLDWAEPVNEATKPAAAAALGPPKATPSSLVPPASSGAAIMTATPVKCAESDPSENFFQLLTLDSDVGVASPLPSLRSRGLTGAVELLLQGLDAKAILKDNAIGHVQLRDKCLSQVDFSFTVWEHVEATSCDFSLCLFYKGFMKGPCIFTSCVFDGSVLNGLNIASSTTRGHDDEVSCGGCVQFVNCTFRRTALGVSYSASTVKAARGAAAEALFVGCDFDLATFEGCTGLTDRPEVFRRCLNCDTAAQFPLRVRAV